jgi:uncharacterized protein with HEPN domain
VRFLDSGEDAEAHALTSSICFWRKSGMRDKVIHDYFGVNLEIVWAVVEKELPKLAEAIRASLET